MRNHIRFAASAVVFLCLGVSTQAMAADITWATPTNITGNASDILTTGALVAAVTAGSTTTVNGVTFAGQTSLSGGVTSFGASSISINGLTAAYSGFNNAPGGWDANYREILAGGSWNGDQGLPVITLSGLTAGNSYVVQIFEPTWNANWATRYTGGANTSDFVNLLGGDVGGGGGSSTVPQYLFGSFVASSTTQDITMSAGTNVEIFGAMQVREAGAAAAAVPEPATWGMMLVGFGMMGVAMRRSRPSAVRFN